MTSTRSQRAVSPKKGRPTPSQRDRRAAAVRRGARSARLEWMLVGVIAIALLVALFAFVGDGGGSGAPTHFIGGHGG